MTGSWNGYTEAGWPTDDRSERQPDQPKDEAWPSFEDALRAHGFDVEPPRLWDEASQPVAAPTTEDRLETMSEADVSAVDDADAPVLTDVGQPVPSWTGSWADEATSAASPQAAAWFAEHTEAPVAQYGSVFGFDEPLPQPTPLWGDDAGDWAEPPVASAAVETAAEELEPEVAAVSWEEETIEVVEASPSTWGDEPAEADDATAQRTEAYEASAPADEVVGSTAVADEQAEVRWWDEPVEEIVEVLLAAEAAEADAEPEPEPVEEIAEIVGELAARADIDVEAEAESYRAWADMSFAMEPDTTAETVETPFPVARVPLPPSTLPDMRPPTPPPSLFAARFASMAVAVAPAEPETAYETADATDADVWTGTVEPETAEVERDEFTPWSFEPPDPPPAAAFEPIPETVDAATPGAAVDASTAEPWAQPYAEPMGAALADPWDQPAAVEETWQDSGPTAAAAQPWGAAEDIVSSAAGGVADQQPYAFGAAETSAPYEEPPAPADAAVDWYEAAAIEVVGTEPDIGDAGDTEFVGYEAEVAAAAEAVAPSDTDLPEGFESTQPAAAAGAREPIEFELSVEQPEAVAADAPRETQADPEATAEPLAADEAWPVLTPEAWPQPTDEGWPDATPQPTWSDTPATAAFTNQAEAPAAGEATLDAPTEDVGSFAGTTQASRSVSTGVFGRFATPEHGLGGPQVDARSRDAAASASAGPAHAARGSATAGAASASNATAPTGDSSLWQLVDEPAASAPAAVERRAFDPVTVFLTVLVAVIIVALLVGFLVILGQAF